MVKLVKNQRGQLAVEMVLLLALTVAIFIAVSTVFREKHILGAFIARPWVNISAMIQNGVWKPNQVHPAYWDRVSSVKGENPK